uniref:Metastasis associated 1 n=1 Tax=Petromyzon marinus TaxID=7757 RepID=S4RGI4_PETMA
HCSLLCLLSDYVFFENSSSNPYLIRRIEELNKTANGNVEAKVVCFYRRRDISSNLISLADKHAILSIRYMPVPKQDLGDERQCERKSEHPFCKEKKTSGRLGSSESLTLFAPALHSRGKCRVTLLNETEALNSYLDKEDCFFYSLVYDPTQKTLLADKGEIRVGPRYQADIPDFLKDGEPDCRDQLKLEARVWDPENPLMQRHIDQFLVIARSVGTFARALDCSSSVRQPSLHMSAAAASRDITLVGRWDAMHEINVNQIMSPLEKLTPNVHDALPSHVDKLTSLVINSASTFFSGNGPSSKDNGQAEILTDFILPWKTLSSIIEYYYMWKTTDRYVQQKRLKAAEAESKLKQVYIPNYNKPNPNQIAATPVKAAVANGTPPIGLVLSAPQNASVGRACESCFATISCQWYSWGPPNMQCRLCSACWTYWKKYGGLKMPTRLESDRAALLRAGGLGPHSSVSRSNGSPKFTLKTRQAFYLQTTKLTRLARRLCRDLLHPLQAARRPFLPINTTAIKATCPQSLAELERSGLVEQLLLTSPRITVLIYAQTSPWDPLEKSVENEQDISPVDTTRVAKMSKVCNILKSKLIGMRQTSVQYNVMCGLSNHGQVRQLALGTRPYLINGKPYPANVKLLKPGGMSLVKRRRMNWIDAPDDVFFMATDETRKVRKLLPSLEMKRAARRPYRRITVKPLLGLGLPSHLVARQPINDEPIVIED